MARAALVLALTGGSLSLHLNGFRCQATTNAQRVTGSVACGSSVGVACGSVGVAWAIVVPLVLGLGRLWSWGFCLSQMQQVFFVFFSRVPNTRLATACNGAYAH